MEGVPTHLRGLVLIDEPEGGVNGLFTFGCGTLLGALVTGVALAMVFF
jgi:hypothetical protein